MTDNKITTKYYLKGKLYASRTRNYAPVVGDEIRFNGKIYVITRRVWIEDDERYSEFHCAVDIKEIKK